MKLNNLKQYFLILGLLYSVVLNAQNTIGGAKTLIPEEEVIRQSKFLDAERERLLGHWDNAVEQYKRFTYDNPGNDAGWYGLARTYSAKNDPANALDAIAKAIAIDPDNQWYKVFQADAFEKDGRSKDAAEVYSVLAKRFPQNPEYLRKLAYFSVLTGEPKVGLKALDRLEEINGVTEETSNKKQVIYIALGDNKKAAAELQKLADAYPAHLEFRHRLAQFYDSIGDAVNAKRVYEDILRRSPNDPVAKIAVLDKPKNSSDVTYLQSLKPLFGNAQVSMDAKLKEVLPFFAKINSPNPDPALLETLLDLGNLLETAHPNDAKALSFTAAVLYQSNRKSEALEKYRQCLRLNPNVFGAWDNTLSILEEQHNYDEMLKVAEQAIDAFPNQAKGYYYYGVAATEKGLYDDAIAQLEQASLMAGNAPIRLDILDQSAVASFRKKDLPAATTKFEQALTKGGDKHPGILQHYGDLLYQKGDKTGAVTNWQKAYDLTKDPVILQKIKGI